MTNTPEHSLNVGRGLSFTETIQVKNDAGVVEDLTGSTFLLQIRDSTYAPDIRISATDANGLLAIIPTQGVITIQLTPTATDALIYSSGIYDLIQTKPNGDKIKLLQGTVSVEPTISRV